MSCVLWFTGISGSGKTTLSVALYQKLKLMYDDIKIEIIDGDDVRKFFGDCGYTREDRNNNIKKIVFATSLLSKNGILTIVANIAPYKEIRDFARKKIENYIEIYVKASVDTCIKRDVKGLYKKYRKGEMKNVVGLDDTYEIPTNPDLIIDTDNEELHESINKLISFIKERNIISL